MLNFSIICFFCFVFGGLCDLLISDLIFDMFVTRI